MPRRSKLWVVTGWLWTLINLGGLAMAAVQGEGLHAAGHVGLLVLGAYFFWYRPARTGQELPSAELADARLAQLQQSVDAIALEVERIGEAQRYIAKVAADQNRGAKT